MVRLGTLLDVRDTSGPVMVMRYNMYSAAASPATPAPGTSSGQAVALMQQIADKEMPRVDGHRVDRAGLPAAPGRQHGDVFFFLAVVFVFLVLAAQYESWSCRWP